MECTILKAYSYMAWSRMEKGEPASTTRFVGFTKLWRYFAASLISLCKVDRNAYLELEMSWLNSSLDALV